MTDRAPHLLDPLLRPRSVAVVGASARHDSMGEWSLKNLQRGGFAGTIYPVNPGYDELAGLRCYPSLAELPETPELAMFAVGDARVESALDDAIRLGVPAAVIMSTLALDDDTTPNLKERVRTKVRDAGMLLCGANGMGFYNVRDRVWACGFDSADHPHPGNVVLISHSGSGMSGLIDSEERLRINLAVSTGNELGVTMDRYLDFALELPETRAVGLFVETARNPEGFRAALAQAADRGIPVVALKVGHTEESRRLTVSHSGAMAGDSAAYDALFDRYGVQQVRDLDELATALILFAELHPVGPGGLVSLHDSGGERQLMIDLADAAGVPLTKLAPATVAALEKVLDPELPAVNPLDGWSRGGEPAGAKMTRCLTLLMQDPGAALGVVQHDRAPYGEIYESYVRYMEAARRESGKPVALVAARQGSGSDRRPIETTHRGMPVLDGVPAFLEGVRALFACRDFQAERDAGVLPEVSADATSPWRTRLGSVGAASRRAPSKRGGTPLPEEAHAPTPPDVRSRLEAAPASGATLDEQESLELLAAFGIDANVGRIVEHEDDLAAAADALGYPLVAKTALPGILHKTEHGGVHLDLRDAPALRDAWRDLAERRGSRVLLAPLVPPGTEMFLGARRDPQFGPVVLFGVGGVHAELLEDVVFALPPFTAEWAVKRLERLKLRKLLDGVRGRPAADAAAFCEMAARFSVMVDALRDVLEEADVNPVIVGAHGAKAVDALIVGRDGQVP